MTSKYINSLVFRHAALKHEIMSELKQPYPDIAYLNVLKKRKLMLKDRMQTKAVA